MFNAELDSERLERLKLQRRRDQETARRERIFDDRLRTIGVDAEALGLQLEEKKKREEEQEEEQKAQDGEMLHNSKVACILQRREKNEKRAMQMELANYWKEHQQPSVSEFDVSDPDPGVMAPGFLGEDPEAESRFQRQQEQLREWIHQQQSEQAAERYRQALERQRDDEMRVEMDDRALRLQRLEKERRRAESVATEEFNLAKIEEKRRQDQDNRVPDMDPNLGRWGVPGLHPGSDLRAPPETLEQVLQFQRNQIEDKKRIELEKKREEELDDRVRLASARSALLLERRQAKQINQMRRHLDTTNVQLAEIHRQQKPDIERGSIDQSFFSNFNTCSR